MRAKFVNEAIKHLTPRSEEEIDKNIKALKDAVKKYLPYLNAEFDGNFESGTQFSVDVPEIHETISLYVSEGEEGVEIKFYYDTVAFNGISSDDEYQNELDWIPIKSFTKKMWKQVVKDISEYIGFDEETYQENQKHYAAHEAEIHKKDSQWIKDNNYKHDRSYDKGSYYEGSWEYNWDEELGKWLDIPERYEVMRKRGYGWDSKNKKFIKIYK